MGRADFTTFLEFAFNDLQVLFRFSVFKLSSCDEMVIPGKARGELVAFGDKF